MKIRCKECGEVTELKERAAIQYYVEGGVIRCRKCGEDVRIETKEE